MTRKFVILHGLTLGLQDSRVDPLFLTMKEPESRLQNQSSWGKGLREGNGREGGREEAYLAKSPGRQV